MKINIQAAAHYLYLPPLIPLKLFFAEPMSKAYCSRAAQDAGFGPVLQIWPVLFLTSQTNWAHSLPRPSKLTSPDPVCVPILCLLLPLSSDPSIRILTPPPRPSLTPHDKLAVAHQTKLDSFKIPPTCKTSYINITEIKRKNANELVEFLWKLNIFGSDGALELILV